MTKIAILLGAILLPDIAGAHPDHASGGDFSMLHGLTDPFHVGLAAVAVLVFITVRRSVLRRHSVKHPAE